MISKDEITRMAREAEKYADAFCEDIDDQNQDHWFDAYNERFASLVSAHTQEQCAKVCEEAANHDAGSELSWAARACAAAIRAMK